MVDPLSSIQPSTPSAISQPAVRHLAGSMFLIGGRKCEVTHLGGKEIKGPLTSEQLNRLTKILTETFQDKEALAAIKKSDGFTIKPNISMGTASIIDHKTSKPIAEAKINNIGSLFSNKLNPDAKATSATSVDPHGAELKLTSAVRENSVQSLLPKTAKHSILSLELVGERLEILPSLIDQRLSGNRISGHALLEAHNLLKETKTHINRINKEAEDPKDFLPKGILRKTDARASDLEFAVKNFRLPEVTNWGGLNTVASVKTVLETRADDIIKGKLGDKQAVASMLSEALSGYIVKANVLSGKDQESSIRSAKQIMKKLEALGVPPDPRINDFKAQLNNELRVVDQNSQIKGLLKKEPLDGNILWEARQIQLTQKNELSKAGNSAQTKQNQALEKEILAKVKTLENKVDSWSPSEEKDIMKAFAKGGDKFAEYIVKNYSGTSKKGAYKLLASEYSNILAKSLIIGGQKDKEQAKVAFQNLLKLPNEILKEIVQEKNIMKMLVASGKAPLIETRMQQLNDEIEAQKEVLDLFSKYDDFTPGYISQNASAHARTLEKGLSRLMNDPNPASQKQAKQIIKNLWDSKVMVREKSELFELVNPNFKNKMIAFYKK